MGVPYYFYVITQQHPGILQKLCPEQVDAFYLDFNGGVHPVCHRLMESTHEDVAKEIFEEKLCQESWNYMMSLVRDVKPSTVHVTLDGVAPVAKIQQQRKRRYLSILRQQLLQKNNAWDSNAISPGTAFMARLNQYFRDKIKQTFSSIPIHFHGSDEAGEGEHKIFHIMKNEDAERPRTRVIYGLDADLIMLSLLSHLPKIHLMREHSNINVKKNETGFVYLDIDALRMGILKTLRQDYQWPISEEAVHDVYGNEARLVIENYVVACFLLGNDFLPNIASLHLKKNGLYSILQSFRTAWEANGHPLITHTDGAEECISFEFMGTWFEELSKQEDEWIWKMNEEYMKKRVTIQNEEDKVEFYPVLPEKKSPLAFEMFKLANPQKWRSLYYKYLMDSERQDMSIVVTACSEYIRGIVWTYSYYKRYKKPFDWYYPYGYAPTMRDICNYLFAEHSSLRNTWEKWQSMTEEESNRFIHPSVQLMAILPKESHHLLPPALVSKINNPSYGVRYMYPSRYPLVTYLKNHLWECHPKLPTLNFAALYKLLR